MIKDSGYFRRSIVQQTLFVLFWISGIATSILMITIQRLISLSFSDSIFTSTLVIASFLGGIALGGYYFGKKIDTSNNEISKFLFLELGIGIYTILFFFLQPLSTIVYKFVFHNFGEQAFIQSFYKYFFVIIFTIIPGIFIGGTFPILSRFFIRSSKNVGREVGNLYGLNLIGLAFGYFLTGFVFLHIFGIKQSLVLAAVLFFFNSAILQILLNRIGATISLETEFYNQKLKHLDPIETVQSVKFSEIIKFSFGVSGFITLVNIILWHRTLVYVLGDYTYTSSIILTIFLIALAFGAILFPRVFKELKNLFPVFGVIQIAIGIFTLLPVIVLPLLPNLNSDLLQLSDGSPSWLWRVLIHFFDVILLIALPAFCMGASFPVVGKTLISNFEKRGYRLGVIFAIKSIGAIAGLFVALFIFIPNFGIQKSIIFISLLSLLLGLVVLFISSLKYGKLSKTSFLFLFVTFIFLFSFFIPSNMISRLFQANRLNDKIVFALEGATTTAIVHQDTVNNQLTLTANGVNFDGTSKDFINRQIIQIHLPLLVHPAPDTVLIMGLGTGKTLEIALLHNIKKIFCTEPYPEIISTSTLFNDTKYRRIENQNFEIKNFSGQNYVSLSDKKFSVIVNTFVQPKYSNMGTYYSQAFYRDCLHRLNQDGIMASLIPLNNLTIENFKILLRTFQSVFPATTVWYNNNWKSQNALLIGFVNENQFIDFNLMQNRINQPNIHASLSQALMENIYEILDCFIMGPEVVEKITGGVRINQKNRPFIEFSSARLIDDPILSYQKIQLFKSYREFVYPYLTNIDSTFKQRQAVKFVLDNYFQNAGDILDAISYEILNEYDLALQVYRAIHIKNKSDQSACRFLNQHFNPYLISSPQTPAEFAENAKIFYQKGNYEKSISNFQKALEIDDTYIPAYFGLGLNYEILGSLDDAKKMYRKTLLLKPNLKEAQTRLDSLLQINDKN